MGDTFCGAVAAKLLKVASVLELLLAGLQRVSVGLVRWARATHGLMTPTMPDSQCLAWEQ